MGILIRIILAGPLLSAVAFFISISIASGEFLEIDHVGALAFTIVIAYIMLFFTPEGIFPGIFPLLIYAILVTTLLEETFNESIKKSSTRTVAVIKSVLLNLLSGLLIYGVFFYISSHRVDLINLLAYMVIPASLFFGVWLGLLITKKTSNKSSKQDAV